MNTAPSPAPSEGAFAPLRQRLFAVLWLATVVGNTGSFVRDVASSWLITGLSPSPLAVALVQAAATLPVFLLAIPAGVLADILDRRKFLLGIQLILAAVSTALMLLSAAHLLSIEALILLTFLGGIGTALMGPTWLAIVPELVSRQELRTAVALNSLGFNIARAIGPAFGGVLLAAFGAAITYGTDVISYVFVIAALLWWKRPKAEQDPLGERFLGAFRAGLRYVRSSREMHVVLLRAFLFFAMASALWALLPLVARQLLGGGAGFYGLLLGAIGLGAIGGALLLPKLRQRLDADGLLLCAALATAAVMAALALAPPRWLAVVLLLLLGAAWIAALTTLNGVAQAILPNWVRGRSLAVYLTVFNGAMTFGSLAWGALASGIGVAWTLLSAAGLLAVVALAAWRIRLPKGDADLLPSHHWPEPLMATSIEQDRGPVLVQIEYRIEPAQRSAFLARLARLSSERRRDGAYAWGVTEDAADATRIVEWFMVESWQEHLRQHRRVSRADADLQAELLQFHHDDAPPQVRHLLAITRNDLAAR
ncbi:MFS transporter [Stenotrophomonas sp. HITSZ_GD]|uniref:MFS transporter n=1 Tax=Stenotrophomonas sp. HITSZ_GD TaxID=3037248 RepID=UPI00240E5FB7|nr:MFS transporter [Stenotrophomonas sp. HITSZ_GD]MDG2524232.1 MFS transporter [Stenotrophomonas sp. HITSZ_GD]